MVYSGPYKSNFPVTTMAFMEGVTKSSITICSLVTSPNKVIVSLLAMGCSTLPATNFPPLIQMFLALIWVSLVASIYRVPSMIKVPNSTSALSKTMVYSQGITTSSPV